LEYIARLSQTAEILDNFRADHSPNQVYMITGVRGSGKTVMMAGIANELAQDDKWVVIELNPQKDLLLSLASGLYYSSLHLFITEAKIDLSVLGIGVSVSGAAPITDSGVAIERMLKILQKHKKRLLITIDEAVNNNYIRVFAGQFQIYMRQGYPVYLIMTGLYDNIYNLQNEKTLTFLYRAPKVILKALNYSSVVGSYRRTFGVSTVMAGEMASITKGYPFAFQVLGYLLWEREWPRNAAPVEDLKFRKRLEEILPEYDQYLEEYVYEKIWSELSPTDKKVVRTMIRMKETNVTSIREALEMRPEKFSVYRKRLINKGVIVAKDYGAIEIALPRFDHFVEMADEQW
jgi:hypothetical protein